MSFDPHFETWLTEKLGSIRRHISGKVKGDVRSGEGDLVLRTTSAVQEVDSQGRWRQTKYSRHPQHHKRPHQNRYLPLGGGRNVIGGEFLDNDATEESVLLHGSTGHPYTQPSIARTLRWLYSSNTDSNQDPSITAEVDTSDEQVGYFDDSEFYHEDEYELDNDNEWGPYEQDNETAARQKSSSSGLTSYKTAMSTGNYYSITFDPDEEDEEMPVFDREVMSARDRVDKILRETELIWDEDDPGKMSSAASSSNDLSLVSRRTGRLNTKGLFGDESLPNSRPRSLVLDQTRDINANGIPTKFRGSGTDILDALDLLETQSNHSEALSHAYSEDGYIVFDRADVHGSNRQNGLVTSRGNADGSSQPQSPGDGEGRNGLANSFMPVVRFRKLKSDFEHREDYMEDDEVEYQDDGLDCEDDAEDFELQQGEHQKGFPMVTTKKDTSDTGSIVKVRLPMEQFEMAIDGNEDDTMLTMADDYSRPEVDISDTQPIVRLDQGELAVAMVKRKKRVRLIAVSVVSTVVGVAAVGVIVYLVVKWLSII